MFLFKFNVDLTHHILDLSWVYLIPWLLFICIGAGSQMFIKISKLYKTILSLALTTNSLNFLLAKRLIHTQ